MSDIACQVERVCSWNFLSHRSQTSVMLSVKFGDLAATSIRMQLETLQLHLQMLQSSLISYSVVLIECLNLVIFI